MKRNYNGCFVAFGSVVTTYLYFLNFGMLLQQKGKSGPCCVLPYREGNMIIIMHLIPSM
jgi:hypothetical protein